METFRAAVLAEWTKLRTIRSTVWTLLFYVAATMAVTVLAGLFVGGNYAKMSAADKAALDPISIGFTGTRFGVLALVVFGVLAMSGEFSSGAIRTFLVAVPRRGVFYAAKLLAASLVTLAVCAATVLVSFCVTQALLGEAGVSLTDQGAARAVVCGVFYAVLLLLFSMGLAALLRSAALTIGILLPLFFMVSGILLSLPGTRSVAQFLPDAAGGVAMDGKPMDGLLLTPLTGMAVLVAWAAAAVAAGYLALRRRDA